jgi:sigma-B regulation protein RsbU (phosphoserine phosphatase)
MAARLKSLYRKLGRIEKAFLVLVLLAAVLAYASPTSLVELLATIAAWIAGFLVVIRLARTAAKKLIWRLRNRLIVAYAFIAMVPVALILALVLVSVYGLTGQIAIYLVNSELERRTAILKGSAATILESPPVHRPEAILRTQDFAQRFFPATEILVRDGSGEYRYPASSAISAPPAGWKDASGIIQKDAQLYCWAHLRSGGAEVAIMAPLSQEYLSSLLPGIGLVSFKDFSENGLRSKPAGAKPASQAARIPPKNNFLDMQVTGGSPVIEAFWNSPDTKNNKGLLLVNTRMSAVLGTLFGNIFLGDMAYGQVIWALFLIIVTLFLIVELVSLVIGVSISRTITSAVHELYVGTRRIKEGDFSHRIPVRGNDQLAELGASFNTMTENLARLIVVAKEKERLESELEIAREVQSQLFPKNMPGTKALMLTGVCNPARVVSGDYYDFMRFESSVAFAIGDVAGKGISAALLMASIQSTMRMQLTAGVPGMSGNGGAQHPVSTAMMVSRLNKLLYANTSPEKYATFYFAVYDETTHTLTYTNAGHLQPILLRKGVPELLEVTGTVVGAFPFSLYEERNIHLSSGDVLVAYTDGMIEPENEYGEMFGEQRLTDLLAKNVDRGSSEIIARTMEAVLQWSGDAAELSDDMTMLVARRA